MSYNVDKQIITQSSTLPAAQSISTSYVEATGSKAQVTLKNDKTSWLYKYTFYTYSTNKPLFLHVQLECSNDNFSSDVQTISGCQRNIAGDVAIVSDKYYQAQTVMFIVDDLDREYLRLSVRSNSTNGDCKLHRSEIFDGSSADVCYNPSLMILEL